MDESVKDETGSRDASPKKCTALIYSQNSFVYTQVSDKSTSITSAFHSTKKPMPLSAGYVKGSQLLNCEIRDVEHCCSYEPN